MFSSKKSPVQRGLRPEEKFDQPVTTAASSQQLLTRGSSVQTDIESLNGKVCNTSVCLLNLPLS